MARIVPSTVVNLPMATSLSSLQLNLVDRGAIGCVQNTQPKLTPGYRRKFLLKTAAQCSPRKNGFPVTAIAPLKLKFPYPIVRFANSHAPDCPRRIQSYSNPRLLGPLICRPASTGVSVEGELWAIIISLIAV